MSRKWSQLDRIYHSSEKKNINRTNSKQLYLGFFFFQSMFFKSSELSLALLYHRKMKIKEKPFDFKNEDKNSSTSKIIKDTHILLC